MTEQLRVGLVHWAFPPTTGGVESHVADLADSLTQMGCKIVVLTGEPSPIVSENYTVISLPLLNIDWVRTTAHKSDSFASDLKVVLRNIILEEGLQVLHGHNLDHFTQVVASVLEELRQELGLRIHHTFHEPWPDLAFDSSIYRNWNGHYTTSQFVQTQCYQRLNFELKLFPLGIDTERFYPHQPLLFQQATPVILHPARLLPWKGVHLSVQMLARLRERGLQATLILTDTQRIADWYQELDAYRHDILETITQLELDNQVQFRPTSYAEMPALYNQADVVIYPTIGEEPYGLVPLEAMSCGRPVVVSASGGIPETVIHNKTGYIVTVGDVKALTDAVYQLLTHPELGQEFGVAGRQHVCQTFDLRRYCTMLLDYYQ
jgi:glycosyltransferase involved in cell wall biosynthesis